MGNVRINKARKRVLQRKLGRNGKKEERQGNQRCALGARELQGADGSCTQNSVASMDFVKKLL